MNKKFFPLAALLITVSLYLFSCKEQQNPKQKFLEGYWKITLWDNMPDSGSIQFLDSNMSFNLRGISELATYSIKDDTISFKRTGGSTNMMSSGNNWAIDSLTNKVLRISSHFGMIVRAEK